MDDKLEQLLAESRTVLKATEIELKLKAPYSRKLYAIEEMLAWLGSDNISLSFCERHRGDVGNYLLEAKDKSVTCIEYRSCREGIERPMFFIVDKSACNNELDGFITLWAHYLNHSGLLRFKNLTQNPIDVHLDTILYPHLAELDYRAQSPYDLDSDITWYTEQALKSILNSDNSFENKDYPSGLFVNHQRLDVDNAYSPAIKGEYLHGVTLKSQWNDVEHFYTTTEQYVLFLWWTSA